MSSELSQQAHLAVQSSTAINVEDVSNDRIHYHLGMWGKLIVLGTIKRQGFHQRVDPETDIDDLYWEIIYLDVVNRFPSKKLNLLSVASLKLWYENRLRIYKDLYPMFYLHGSIIDELIRHYSFQLLTLNDCLNSSHIKLKEFYWGNFHTLPLLSVETFCERYLVRSNDTKSTRSGQFTFLSPPSFCSLLSPEVDTAQEAPFVDEAEEESITECNKERQNLESLNLKTATQEEEEEVDVETIIGEDEDPGNVSEKEKTLPSSSESCQDNVSNSSEIELPTPAVERDRNESSVDLVVEHETGPKQKAEVSKINLRKRAFKDEDPSANGTINVEVPTPKKHPRLQEVDLTKSLLLSVLARLRAGQGTLSEISNKMANLAGEKCEYTLPAIEEKIRSEEIRDVESILHSCRCLVVIYLQSRKTRKIPEEAMQLLKKLSSSKSDLKGIGLPGK